MNGGTGIETTRKKDFQKWEQNIFRFGLLAHATIDGTAPSFAIVVALQNKARVCSPRAA
jgi:hypothetical protein